jgi:hypothetical protein
MTSEIHVVIRNVGGILVIGSLLYPFEDGAMRINDPLGPDEGLVTLGLCVTYRKD